MPYLCGKQSFAITYDHLCKKGAELVGFSGKRVCVGSGQKQPQKRSRHRYQDGHAVASDDIFSRADDVFVCVKAPFFRDEPVAVHGQAFFVRQRNDDDEDKRDNTDQ